MHYKMSQQYPLSPLIFSFIYKYMNLACLIRPIGGLWKIQVAEFKHDLLPYAGHILGLLYLYIKIFQRSLHNFIIAVFKYLVFLFFF